MVHFKRLFCALGLIVTAGVCGCDQTGYRAAPVDPAAGQARLAERGLADPGLRAFMATHGAELSAWPLARWDVGALTLAAIYFHPDIAVARAEWAVAAAGQVTADRRPNPLIEPMLEYHSDRDDGDDGPWSVGFAVEIPLAGESMRAARRARAAALTEAALVAVAEAAWTVRSTVRARMLACHNADRRQAFLADMAATFDQIAAAYATRQTLGEASAVDRHQAEARRDQAHLAVARAAGEVATARVALAGALGLPRQAVDGLVLDYGAFESLAARHPSGPAVQRAALRNRLDVRTALARYAVHEAALRVEIARRQPAITLSPGFLWDQGDLVWSLAGGLLVPLFDRNQGPIGEAGARRDLAAAEFDRVQAAALAALDQALAGYQAAADSYRAADGLRDHAARRYDQVSVQVAHGESGRLELLEARIAGLAADQAALERYFDVLAAWGAIEDAVQRPLDGTPMVPDGLAGAAAGRP